MGSLLAQVRELLAECNHPKPLRFRPDLKLDPTQEVSEHQGVLLVRLGRGSAMQVRVTADAAAALYRIVAIATVKHVDDDRAWQRASDGQIRAWLHDDSPIGRWLRAKGFECDPVAGPLAHAAAL